MALNSSLFSYNYKLINQFRIDFIGNKNNNKFINSKNKS